MIDLNRKFFNFSHFSALTVSTVQSLPLPFPYDDKSAVVAGGQEGLVVVEGDREGGEGVRLQFVDAGLAGSGDVEEVNPAVLRGGDDTLPAPVGHQGSEAGPDVEVRVN